MKKGRLGTYSKGVAVKMIGEKFFDTCRVILPEGWNVTVDDQTNSLMIKLTVEKPIGGGRAITCTGQLNKKQIVTHEDPDGAMAHALAEIIERIEKDHESLKANVVDAESAEI